VKLSYLGAEVTSSLSKVIKARFVIEGKSEKLFHNSSPAVMNNGSLAVQETQNDIFTRETAEQIYNETKQMIEELMEAAQQQAGEILLQAKSQAQDLVEKSQREIELLKDQAYQAGFEQGYQEGLHKAEEAAASLRQQAGQIIESLLKEREQAWKKYEKDIIELVILLTEKVIGTVAENKPEAIKNLVKKVLKETGEAEKLTVKVNPVHIPFLTVADIQPKDKPGSKIMILEEPSLQPGECIVVSENGSVEARISEQLDILKQTLLEVTGHAGV